MVPVLPYPLPSHAGWTGFRLGGWAPPSTLSLVPGLAPHAEDAAFEAEDVLGLAFAFGGASGLLGDGCGPINTSIGGAAAAGGGGGVGGSGSGSGTASGRAPVGRLDPLSLGVHLRAPLASQQLYFPMDEGYIQPLDKDLYYGDVSVQRRLLQNRYNFGRGSGGLNWEEGLGTGLAAGLCGGVAVDGRGWEWVGTKESAAILPLDDERTNGGGASVPSYYYPPSLSHAQQGTTTTTNTAATIPGGVSTHNFGSTGRGMALTGFSKSTAPGQFTVSVGESVSHNPSLMYPLTCARAASRAATRRLAASGGVKLKHTRFNVGGGGGGEEEEEEEEVEEGGGEDGGGKVRGAGMQGGEESSSSRSPPQFVIRPRIGRGGRILFDRLAPGFRPELAGYMEDTARTLSKRATVVREARANMLRTWGVPFSSQAVEACEEVIPSCFTVPGAYRALFARSVSEGVGRECHPPPVHHSEVVKAGGEGSKGGALATFWRKDGATTSYTHFPAFSSATLGAQSFASAASLLNTMDPLTTALATNPGALVASSAFPPETICPRGSTLAQSALASLFSSHLDDIVSGGSGSGGGSGGGGVGGKAAGVTPLALLQQAGAALTTTFQPPPLMVLRNASLRFAAGLDATPALPKHIPKRLPNVTSLSVHETKFSDLFEGKDSDDEEGRGGLVAIGTGGSTGWRDPGAVFHEANLAAYERAVPLK